MSTPFRIVSGPQKIAGRCPNRWVRSLDGAHGLDGLAAPQPLPGRYALTADSILDFETDWSRLLVADEIIVAASFTVEPSPNGTLTLSDETFSATTSTVWVTGGVPENFYHVAAGVTTSAGRTYDHDLTFKILPGLVPSVGGVLGGSGTLSCAGNLGYNGVYAPYAVGFTLPVTTTAGHGQLSASAIPSWRMGGSGHLTSAAQADEFRVIGSLHGGGEL
jgi:hypothetical protein